MARRASKVDANQSTVVQDLRNAGAMVQTLHAVGMGCPDILVGFRGKNLLMEIKDGAKTPSETKLTPMQVRWHQTWGGQVCTVYSSKQAIDVMYAETNSIPFRGIIT